MNVIGVDGCKAGWFYVHLFGENKWAVGTAHSVGQLLRTRPGAKRVLIDIPIGLSDGGSHERVCDLRARRLLGRPRSSSVFRPPCRPTLLASSYPEASQINRELTGRAISKQTWNIAGKIREVDDLLQRNPRLRQVFREVHPELLFWALNQGQSMQHGKRQEAGFEERLKVLGRCYPESETIARLSLARFQRKVVARDDILDALAAAVTGWLGGANLQTIPKTPERDPTGLSMEMVYFTQKN